MVKSHDIGYPFEIEMINVGNEVGDIDFDELNPYVSLALVTMKFFLDPKNKIDNRFIQEVFLCLGNEASSEYKEAVMDRPEIMEERKRNGFVSVADVFRAEDEVKGLVQSAKNFLAMGLSLERVSKGTGLSVVDIQKYCF